jgi:hypothetical protein
MCAATPRASTKARSRRRPPHRGHFHPSSPKTRHNRSAHDTHLEQVLGVFVSLRRFGRRGRRRTTSLRHAERDANTETVDVAFTRAHAGPLRLLIADETADPTGFSRPPATVPFGDGGAASRHALNDVHTGHP